MSAHKEPTLWRTVSNAPVKPDGTRKKRAQPTNRQHM